MISRDFPLKYFSWCVSLDKHEKLHAINNAKQQHQNVKRKKFSKSDKICWKQFLILLTTLFLVFFLYLHLLYVFRYCVWWVYYIIYVVFFSFQMQKPLPTNIWNDRIYCHHRWLNVKEKRNLQRKCCKEKVRREL